MPSTLVEFAKLAPLGFLVGLYGTLVGAGGGFLLVPALLLLLPDESPGTLTSVSLAVVFFNAYSGTIAYARMGRIDYFAALLFAVAGLPGAVLGTVAAHEVPRSLFEPAFGLVLLVGGIWLALRPLGTGARREGAAPDCGADRYMREGQFNTLVGAVGSAYIGFFASLLGIGGGVIHVPFLVRVLRFPPHVATATSHMVLAILAFVATVSHFALGAFNTGLDRTMYLAVGVMMGAPLGAILSTRVRDSLLIRLLALALCIVGARLVVARFSS